MSFCFKSLDVDSAEINQLLAEQKEIENLREYWDQFSLEAQTNGLKVL